MSGDPAQEYFSDGITDEIITALSRSPWLFIIARNTTFTYNGQSVGVRRGATDHGARFVLEGSVRRAGPLVRVTAQLIDGLTGGHVWSDRYDGQIDDVFELQGEITRQVVASIQTIVHLNTIEAPVERLSRPDLIVWELTMRAWHLLYSFSPDAYAAAKPLLERALALEPESAEANTILSLINHHVAILGFAPDSRHPDEAANALGRRATQLDDRNEYAHWGARQQLLAPLPARRGRCGARRAVELNPNCSVAYGCLGTALALVGRTGESIANQETANRINPRDPSIFFRFSGLALAHYMARRETLAILWAERAVHRMPRWHFGLAASQMALGQAEAARATVRSCQAVLPGIGLEATARVPIQDPDRMQEFCDRLAAAVFDER